MAEAVVVVIGLGVVAAGPRVRVLRPVLKLVLKTGFAVTEATITFASVITQQISDLAAHVRADHANGTVMETEAAREAVGAAPAVPAWLDNTDLLQIDGVGPKVSGLLKNAGIETITQLAVTQVERLREILNAASPRFGAIDSSTWPEQAQALLAGEQA